MKKSLLIAVLAIIANSTFAQTIKFGLDAGINLANQSFHANSETPTFNNTKNITDFHAGGLVDIGFTHFSLQPGLLYINKGYQFNEALTTVDGSMSKNYDFKFKYHYLELPINVLYKAQVGTGKVFAGAGPYVAYALSGSAPFLNNSPGGTQRVSLFDYINNKRFDYGLNFTAGYQLKNGFGLSAQYGLGLGNLEDSKYGSQRNRVISLSVLYFFK